MEFKSLYSGSHGNLYTVTAACGSQLMLECGVPWAKALDAFDYKISAFVGCLLTHSHMDHAKSYKEVLKAGIPIWSSPGTGQKLGIEFHRNFNAIWATQRLVKIGPFQVIAFNSHHDDEQPFYYIIRADGEQLLFVTDTSHISERFNFNFDLIAIECNWDKKIVGELVDRQVLNESLAIRILRNHMEKSVCIDYLSNYCKMSRTREIILLHGSGTNLDKEPTREEIENLFFIPTFWA